MVAGALTILMAHTVAARQHTLAHAPYIYHPNQTGQRPARQLEMAYTLLEHGLVYTRMGERIQATFAANALNVDGVLVGAQARPGPGGGRVQHVDIGPWLVVPGDGAPVVRDIGNGSNYGYSVVVAATWALLGTRTLATASYWVFLLDPLAVLACFWLGRRLAWGSATGRNICGLAVGFLFAQFQPHIDIVQQHLWHGFVTYTALACACVLVADARRHPLWLGLLLGVIIGVGNEMRGILMLLPVAVGVAMWIRVGWRRSLVGACACVLAMGGVHTLVQHRVDRQMAALDQRPRDRHAFWHIMLLGLGDFPNAYGFGRGDLDGDRAVQAAAPGTRYQSAAYEGVARGLVMRQIREHPGWYVGLMGQRLGRILTFYDTNFRVRLGAPPFGITAHPSAVHLALALLWPVGVAGALARRDRTALGVLPLFAYFIAMPTATTANSPAYYMAGSMGLMLFAVLGAHSAWRWGGHAAALATGPATSVLRRWRAYELPLGRLEALARLVAVGLLTAAAARAAWGGWQILRLDVPWSAHEGYAAAFASTGDAMLPPYAGVDAAPQGFLGLPLVPVSIRLVGAVTGWRALHAARALSVACGLAMAAAAGWFLWRHTRKPWAVGVGVAAVLAIPALHTLDGLRPAALAAGACALWALASLDFPGRAGRSGVWAALLWATACLLEPGAAAWGVALGGVAISRGRRRAGAVAVGGGAGIAALALVATVGTEGLAELAAVRVAVWTSWPALPLIGARGVTDTALVVAGGLLGALMWAARGHPLAVRSDLALAAVLLLTSGVLLAANLVLLPAAAILLFACVALASRVRTAAAAGFGQAASATLGFAAICCTGGLAALAPMFGAVVAGLCAWAPRARTRAPLLADLTLACVAAGLSFQVSAAFAVPVACTIGIVWVVHAWTNGGPRGSVWVLLAGVALVIQGALWLVVRPPAPHAADVRTLRTIAEQLREPTGEILTEGWYGFAANTGGRVAVHAESLRVCVAAGLTDTEALVARVERQEYAHVLYSAEYFSGIPRLRDAIFAHYAPAERFTVQSAEGTTTLFRLDPIGAPPAPLAPARGAATY